MKKTSINKLSVIICIIGTAAVFNGCVRRYPVMDMLSTENLDTGYIGISVAEPHMRDMNAAVVATAGTETAGVVAGIVEAGIRETLSQQGYKQTFDRADFMVNMDVSASRYDSFGEFLIYDAAANTEIFGPPQMNSVASHRFSARGERKLGQGAALSDAAVKLTAAIRDWLAGVLTPERLRVVTSDVTAVLPERFQMTPSEYAVMMAGTIAELSGVYACRVLNIAGQTVLFQVDYNSDAFPEGLDTWLTAVKQPETIVLSRTIVIITVPKRYRMTQGEYARLFIETLSELEGIESCRVVDRDPENRTTRFEVIYTPDAFADGLYYRLTGLEKLDLAEE
jgi:hypothetical protein